VAMRWRLVVVEVAVSAACSLELLRSVSVCLGSGLLLVFMCVTRGAPRGQPPIATALHLYTLHIKTIFSFSHVA
jgi:hypothetical protein